MSSHRIAGMKSSLFATLLGSLLLSGIQAPAPLHAASAILRCKSPDGTLVYTDKACGAFGAKAAPIPGELLGRIYRDEARFGDGDSSIPTAQMATVGRRAASDGCAHTPTQLAMDLRGSLALGDVNRVAESYHWVGMSSRQGERTLDRLQGLIGKPVLDSHYFDAQIGAAVDGTPVGGGGAMLASNDASIGGDAGMLQLVLGGGDTARSAIDFDVHRYAGCYFVTF
jgi:hypothetical protein